MDNRRSVAVIGGGPGGYVAAIKAAQLGARVTLVEKGRLGGTCLNAGCIPTKILLHTAELYNQLRASKSLGLKVDNFEVDWKGLMERKEEVVNGLVKGVTGLMKANGIDVVEGTASFKSPGEIMVELPGGGNRSIETDAFIIATGSAPFIPPIEGTELEGVIGSTRALSLDQVPESMVIIGGGVIGVEFATIYSSLGCDVTVLEMMPRILPNMEEEMTEILKNSLAMRGVKVFNGARVTSIDGKGRGLMVHFELDGKNRTADAEKVLVAVGRKPFTEGLNLEAAGVKLVKGCVNVNDRMETNVGNIFAIGDCTGKNMLAHVASAQGEVAARNIMGQNTGMDYRTVPACVYTQPEMAGVGLTERQAREKGYDVKVGKFPLAASGKALIMNDTGGMVKIVADRRYDEVLGVHILGPRATDLIAEGALALRLEATLEEIATTIHAHPTVGEAVMEAALAADNAAVHIPNKKG